VSPGPAAAIAAPISPKQPPVPPWFTQIVFPQAAAGNSVRRTSTRRTTTLDIGDYFVADTRAFTPRRGDVVLFKRVGDPDTIYVIASKGGAPTNPDWYANMTEAGTATVEVGIETYPVTVTELTGEERDRVYAEQASRYPFFAEYAEKNAGIRTIPVLALTRAT